MQRVVKPKTQRAKRALEERAPKVVENTKMALYLGGHTCSQVVKDVFRDLHNMTKPHSALLTRKHEAYPFEDDTLLEKFSKKYDASLFMFGSSNKKRPHNITMGRMFDFHVLDMIELGVDSFKPMKEFKVPKHNLGSKPCLTFHGDLFESSEELKRVRNIFMDFFRGANPKAINLSGIDHVISVTAVSEKKIVMRQFRVMLKKSGTRLPLVELEEEGPRVDFSLRRTRFAAPDLMKAALRVPKELKAKKVKNIEHNAMGEKLGRIHLGSQDLSKLQLRKVRALKKRKSDVSEYDNDNDNDNDNTGAAAAAVAAAAADDEPRSASKRRRTLRSATSTSSSA